MTRRTPEPACKACQTRALAGLAGQCPTCASERVRAERAAKPVHWNSNSGVQQHCDTADWHTAEEVHRFEVAVSILRQIGNKFTLYVANDTLCLIRGESHDKQGNPLRENIIASAGGLRISGGDW